MNPEPQRVSMTPKDFFLHLGIIVALYVTAISLIALLLQVIDFALPDAVQRYYYHDPYSTGIRSAIASLIVFFPTYILLGWLYRKDLVANPAKKDLGIRRWAVYLTLFLAGLTIVVDLVVLINNFLGGEISSRFVLKVLAVLAVAGLIFIYYILNLKGKTESKGVFRGFAIGASIAVVASLAVGFSVLGSPMTQRNIRFDEQRVSDLQNIQWQIVNYWQQKHQLPTELGQLNDSISGMMVPVDPQTKTGYEYRIIATSTSVTSSRTFELCGTFALTREMKDSYGRGGAYPMMDIASTYPAGGEQDSWDHEAGRVCFERTIDPDRYPPIVKPTLLE